MKGTFRAAIATAIGSASLFAAPAAATAPAPDFDWHGHGGCTVPVIGMPTEFGNVAPYIPDEEEPKIVGAAGSDSQVGLIFVFIRCPENVLDTERGDHSRADVTQVMAGVLYQARTLEDVDKAQFYLLSSAINWEPFVLAEDFFGLPSEHQPSAYLNVFRDPSTGLGTFTASVPGGAAPFSASGQILSPNPSRDFPQDAVHFYRTAAGLVRVHHDESWAAGNEAVGAISAAPGSLVAQWMGATTRDAVGVHVWIHDTLHVHRYRFAE